MPVLFNQLFESNPEGKWFDASPKAPPAFCRPHINLGSHTKMACTAQEPREVSKLHLFCESETGIAPIELVDNQGLGTLVIPIHTIIQSSNSSWSLGRRNHQPTSSKSFFIFLVMISPKFYEYFGYIAVAKRVKERTPHLVPVS